MKDFIESSALMIVKEGERVFKREYLIEDFVFTVRIKRNLNDMVLQCSAGLMGPDGSYDCHVDIEGSPEEAVESLFNVLSVMSPPPPRINHFVKSQSN